MQCKHYLHEIIIITIINNNLLSIWLKISKWFMSSYIAIIFSHHSETFIFKMLFLCLIFLLPLKCMRSFVIIFGCLGFCCRRFLVLVLGFFAGGHGRTARAVGRVRAVTEFCGSCACVFRGAAGGNHPSRDLPVSFYSCLSFAESI